MNMTIKDPRVLVIASAGGHLTQAMCSVSMIDNIYLVSNHKNINSSKIQKIFKIIDTQNNPFIHFLNIFFAVYVLLRVRPKAVFSTGGPIALPFALLCKIINKRFIYLDTLSRVTELSNTGKLINKYSLASKMFVQWQSMADKHKLPYIGKSFDILNENDYSYDTLACPEKPIIFVTVGTSQYKFSRLFRMLCKLDLYHSDEVYWIIQSAHNDVTSPPKSGHVVDMVSRDEMDKYVQNASLVISHCGIGSINLMLSYQKRVFFVPRMEKYEEFSDDHQLQIANDIGSDIFTVVYDETNIPEISVQELKNLPILASPIDTTNYKVATQLKKELLGEP